MTLDQYQIERRVTDNYVPEQAAFCHALGLGSESGEVMGKVEKHYRKNREFNPDDDMRLHIAQEIGDVLWYAAGMADDIGYSLSDILDLNIAKLRDRQQRNEINSLVGGDDR